MPDFSETKKMLNAAEPADPAIIIAHLIEVLEDQNEINETFNDRIRELEDNQDAETYRRYNGYET